MYTKKKRGLTTKLCVTLLALALVLGCAVGGTIAWLTAQTDSVVNTFTIGKVDILLQESKYNSETNKFEGYYNWVTSNEYKVIPGRDMPKDPYVRVYKGSEPCWLFIKVEENNFIDGMHYTINSKWTKLDGEENIYYQECTPRTVGSEFKDNVLYWPVSFDILANNKIFVDDEITKEDLAAIKDKTVSLNFTAYAIQYEGFPDVKDAWEQVNATYKVTTTTPAE